MDKKKVRMFCIEKSKAAMNNGSVESIIKDAKALEKYVNGK